MSVLAQRDQPIESDVPGVRDRARLAAERLVVDSAEPSGVPVEGGAR